jgi:hypothetical protein
MIARPSKNAVYNSAPFWHLFSGQARRQQIAAAGGKL